MPERTSSSSPSRRFPATRPRTSWLKRHFIDDGREALEALAREASRRSSPWSASPSWERARSTTPRRSWPRAQIQGAYRKTLLPNYGVFDERRYFEPGASPALIELNGVRVGLTICEDIWFPGPPASEEARAGASLIVNLSASPYHRGKGALREAMLVERAAETGAAFALCNLVGGQDELVFDGHSLVVSASGELLARGPQFEQALVVCDLELASPTAPRARAFAPWRGSARPSSPPAPPSEPAPTLGDEPEVYAALVTGVHDYVSKNGFERALVAVSGGIDSALVALVAADALGPDRLTCVVMPSPHSSPETQADARTIAANLGAELIEIPIEDAMHAYGEAAGGSRGRRRNRCRRGPRGREPAGAHPRQPDHGALQPQRLAGAHHRQQERDTRSATRRSTGTWRAASRCSRTCRRRSSTGWFATATTSPAASWCRPRCSTGAPSAELRPGQRDDDSLPPYEILDRILEAYVEEDRGREQMIADGLPADVVDEVIALVDRAEYKRRQAPPGIKITPRAFGRDRRMPITNRYRG